MLALIIGAEFVLYAIFSWISSSRKKKKNNGYLNTKVLSEMRSYGRQKVGVFVNDLGEYMVVLDRYKIGPQVSDFRDSDRPDNEFQILEDNIKDLEEARKICDEYRRIAILKRVREKRYGNAKRYY